MSLLRSATSSAHNAVASEPDHVRASIQAKKCTAIALCPDVAAAYIEVPSNPIWLAKGQSFADP